MLPRHLMLLIHAAAARELRHADAFADYFRASAAFAITLMFIAMMLLSIFAAALLMLPPRFRRDYAFADGCCHY